MNAEVTPLRTLIVDDEALARRGLRHYLQSTPQIDVVGEARNGREALEFIDASHPDLVFLDIQMPGLSGLDVVREIPSSNMPQIVFVTAFDHYAVQAFEINAIDYLLKPIDPDRLNEAIARVTAARTAASTDDRKALLMQLFTEMTGQPKAAIEALLERAGAPYPDRLTIRDGQDITIIPVEDIDWIDAAGDYMCIHASGETHVLRSTMKALEDMLDPERFARVHRSTIANLSRIEKLTSHINGEFFLTLRCGARLKLSRSYRDRIAHLL